VRLAPSQIKLPQNIGPLRYTGQNRFSDRRLGRSYTFNAPGISLSMYVYDYGLKHIDDGPNSVALCEQFEGAKREIERGGNYHNVELRAEFSRPFDAADGAPVAREALYEFDRNDVRALSALWLTAVDGQFLKLRLSLRMEVADELDDARSQILAAMAAAIVSARSQARGAARAPAARDPAPAQDSSVEVDSAADPGAAASWLSYALELERYSREHPDLRPACGGRLVPDLGAELAARRAALATYRGRAADARPSRYFDELSRIEEAGFLEEYLWTWLREQHRESAPSRELQVGEFEAMRRREMPGHVVQSGARVRIHTVRALPLAPDVH